MSTKQAPLSCQCHVPRCSVCGKCSRCGCSHDGIDVDTKLNRARGRPSSAKKQRVDNAEDVEPSFHHTAAPSFEGLLTIDTTKTIQPRTSRAILYSLNYTDEKIYELLHNIPSLSLRSQPDTWVSNNSNRQTTMLHFLDSLFTDIFGMFCGENDEAAAAAASAFYSYKTKQPNVDCGRRDLAQLSMLKVANKYTKSAKASVEKRVLRAILCDCFTQKELKSVVADLPTFTLSNNSHAAALHDIIALNNGRKLEVTKRCVQRFDTAKIDHAVDFMLSSTNVSFISWGTKTLTLDNKAVIFPAILRKKARDHVYDDYVVHMLVDEDKTNYLSRTTFYRIISTLTSFDPRLRTAVDYVTGFLVNDPENLLSRLIGQLNGDNCKEKFLKDLEWVTTYLKYGFERHIWNKTPCLLHDTEYGLNIQQVNRQNDCVCNNCCSLFNFYARLKNVLVEIGAVASAIEVVQECSLKAKLFLGHKLRVINQQMKLQQMKDDMQASCIAHEGSAEAIVLLDFKMKFEPIYFREKTVDHYGKRGITWHGVMIDYYTYEFNTVEDTWQAVDNKIYFDQVCDNDSKQDREAVLSLLEVTFYRIKRELPHIKRVTLLSDNATCYQNTLLPIVLPFIGNNYGIQVSRFVHTETQDGKSVLDAHFACASKLLKLWVKEGNDCVTPLQVVNGLRSHWGLPNCVVDLVTHNRNKLQSLIDTTKHVETKIKRYLKRTNDLIFLHSPANADTCQSCNEYKTSNSFVIHAYQYSNVGDGTKIVVNPTNNTCYLAGNIDNMSTDNCLPTCANGSQDDADANNYESQTQDTLQIQDINDDTNEENEYVEIIAATNNLEDVPIEQEHFTAATNTIGKVTGVTIVSKGQLFKRTREWVEHKHYTVPNVATCTQCTNRNCVSYAIRRALTMQSVGNLVIIGASNGIMANTLTTSNATNRNIPYIFEAGWACRPLRGQMYGQNYIDLYADDIKAMFELGEQNSSEKKSPRQMLEQLHLLYPGRYNFPGENSIRQQITKLIKQSSKAEQNCNQHNNDNATANNNIQQPRREKFTARHNTFLLHLVQADANTKPRHAVQQFRATFDDAQHMTDSQISSKFSTLKQKYKPNAPLCDN